MDGLKPEKYVPAYKKGTLPDFEHQQLCPFYREAALLDLLGKKLPKIDEVAVRERSCVTKTR